MNKTFTSVAISSLKSNKVLYANSSKQIKSSSILYTDLENYGTRITAIENYGIRITAIENSYLSTTNASTTYQTQTGMSSYLTSTDAASNYQTQTGMSSYLTSADASNTYATKASPTFTGTINIPNYSGSYNSLLYSTTSGAIAALTSTENGYVRYNTESGYTIDSSTYYPTNPSAGYLYYNGSNYVWSAGSTTGVSSFTGEIASLYNSTVTSSTINSVANTNNFYQMAFGTASLVASKYNVYKFYGGNNTTNNDLYIFPGYKGTGVQNNNITFSCGGSAPTFYFNGSLKLATDFQLRYGGSAPNFSITPLSLKHEQTTANTSSGYYLTCKDSTASPLTKAYIDYLGNFASATGTYGTISDIRLKENISAINTTDIYNRFVNAINSNLIKSYNYIGETDIRTGFIADEIEQIFPETVYTSQFSQTVNDVLVENIKQIKLNDIITTLWAIVTEQQKEIISLKSIVY